MLIQRKSELLGRRRLPVRKPGVEDPGLLLAFVGGTPIALGGTEDHVRVLAGLKAAQAPASVVRELKKVSSVWAAEQSPGFAWQAGYGAFSIAAGDVQNVAAYIACQEEHHRKKSSADVLRTLLKEHGIAVDEAYFE